MTNWSLRTHSVPILCKIYLNVFFNLYEKFIKVSKRDLLVYCKHFKRTIGALSTNTIQNQMDAVLIDGAMDAIVTSSFFY